MMLFQISKIFLSKVSYLIISQNVFDRQVHRLPHQIYMYQVRQLIASVSCSQSSESTSHATSETERPIRNRINFTSDITSNPFNSILRISDHNCLNVQDISGRVRKLYLFNDLLTMILEEIRPSLIFSCIFNKYFLSSDKKAKQVCANVG